VPQKPTAATSSQIQSGMAEVHESPFVAAKAPAIKQKVASAPKECQHMRFTSPSCLTSFSLMAGFYPRGAGGGKAKLVARRGSFPRPLPGLRDTMAGMGNLNRRFVRGLAIRRF